METSVKKTCYEATAICTRLPAVATNCFNVLGEGGYKSIAATIRGH